MVRPVYSTLFFSGTISTDIVLAGLYDTETIVVRDITAVGAATAVGSLEGAFITPITFAIGDGVTNPGFWSPGDGFPIGEKFYEWQGRIVIPPGDWLQAYISPDWEWLLTVSGYLLTAS